MDDRELIDLYLDNGDVSAFNTLVRRHQKPVYNFILKMVSNRAEAADLSQTVFIRCFRSLKKLKNRSLFSPWLYRIAVNAIRDHHRKKKEVYSIDGDDSIVERSEGLFIGVSNPAADSESFSRAELVRAALEKIPAEQREVLILKVYQGLKFTEIAFALNQPLNTVKSRLYYGFRAMRKVFEEMNIEESLRNEV